jgi:NAD(P)-dependent dehydrogenase (short-subunit alcohol dehydrogenase family)
MKSIIITGANGNLGTVVVNHFVAKGYNVFAFVSPGKTPSGNSKQNLTFVETDLLNEATTAACIEQIARQHDIEAAFLLAGGFAMGSLKQTALSDVQAMIQLNFYTAYSIVRPFIASMQAKGITGKLVFMGALPAVEWPTSNAMVGYALSKAMLISLSQSINAVPDNAQVTVLVPSVIDTPANRAAMPQADRTHWIKPNVIAQQLEKILLQPWQPAHALIKLY